MKNAGYEIVMMEEFNKIEHLGVAIGARPNSFPEQSGEETQYVTWEYRKEDYDSEPNFFWGHYFLHKDSAYEDYHKRLITEYTRQRELREDIEDEG